MNLLLKRNKPFAFFYGRCDNTIAIGKISKNIVIECMLFNIIICMCRTTIRTNAYIIKKYIREGEHKTRINGARMCGMVGGAKWVDNYFTIKQHAIHASVTEIVYRAQVYINIP